MNIAIIVNRERDPEFVFANETVTLFRNRASLWMEREMEPFLQGDGLRFATRDELFSLSDLILVLGGDGTILSTAREGAKYGKPMVGINIGHLGFLSSVELHNLPLVVDRILNGDYIVHERMMLSAKVIRDGAIHFQTEALNDVVIARGSFSRLVDMKAYIDRRFLCEFPSDGVVIATPTGSTAYALSAGGPVVAPEMNAFVVVPICPHVLNARSMVLPPNGELRLVIRYGESGGASVTADGQDSFPLETGDEIVISESPHVAKLVRLKDISFYELLNAKLTGNKGEESYEK